MRNGLKIIRWWILIEIERLSPPCHPAGPLEEERKKEAAGSG